MISHYIKEIIKVNTTSLPSSFITIMKLNSTSNWRFDIPLCDDHDPLEPNNFRDIFCNSFDQDEKECTICNLFGQRATHAIHYLKGLIQSAAARFFVDKGIINTTALYELNFYFILWLPFLRLILQTDFFVSSFLPPSVLFFFFWPWAYKEFSFSFLYVLFDLARRL